MSPDASVLWRNRCWKQPGRSAQPSKRDLTPPAVLHRVFNLSPREILEDQSHCFSSPFPRIIITRSISPVCHHLYFPPQPSQLPRPATGRAAVTNELSHMRMSVGNGGQWPGRKLGRWPISSLFAKAIGHGFGPGAARRLRLSQTRRLTCGRHAARGFEFPSFLSALSRQESRRRLPAQVDIEHPARRGRRGICIEATGRRRGGRPRLDFSVRPVSSRRAT